MDYFTERVICLFYNVNKFHNCVIGKLHLWIQHKQKHVSIFGLFHFGFKNTCQFQMQSFIIIICLTNGSKTILSTLSELPYENEKILNVKWAFTKIIMPCLKKEVQAHLKYFLTENHSSIYDFQELIKSLYPSQINTTIYTELLTLCHVL